MRSLLPFRASRWLLVLLTAYWTAVPALAQEAPSEQALRAVLLFNFLKFTDWPAEASQSRLLVCIASSDPQQLAAMEALTDRQVRGRTVSTVRLRPQYACDVIYVDSRQRWSDIADHQAGQPVLTIGGYKGFLADGGMIELALDAEHGAHFNINLQEAKRSGLRFYPQLLRLARRIVE